MNIIFRGRIEKCFMCLRITKIENYGKMNYFLNYVNTSY